MPGEFDPHGVESQSLLKATDFNGARVLEIGSGDGRLSFRFARTPSSVIGIEPELKVLETALKTCPFDLRRRISFVQATALALPFRDGSFDIAVLAWSL